MGISTQKVFRRIWNLIAVDESSAGPAGKKTLNTLKIRLQILVG